LFFRMVSHRNKDDKALPYLLYLQGEARQHTKYLCACMVTDGGQLPLFQVALASNPLVL